jgi:hypothetical protein
MNTGYGGTSVDVSTPTKRKKFVARSRIPFLSILIVNQQRTLEDGIHYKIVLFSINDDNVMEAMRKQFPWYRPFLKKKKVKKSILECAFFVNNIHFFINMERAWGTLRAPLEPPLLWVTTLYILLIIFIHKYIYIYIYNKIMHKNHIILVYHNF